MRITDAIIKRRFHAPIFSCFYYLFLITGCQHTGEQKPATRIGKIIVQPINDSNQAVIAASLRSRFQTVRNDINRQLPPDAPSSDLIVDVEEVKYVAPSGIFMFGRSRLEGRLYLTSQADVTPFKFKMTDAMDAPLGTILKMDSYYSPRETFARLSDNLAAKFSSYYGRTYGIGTLNRYEVATRAGPAFPSQPTVPTTRHPGQVAPPPLVLRGGT